MSLGALVVLAGVVPLVSGRTTVGPFPLEPVIAGMALALAASWPFLRRLGWRRVPANLIEVPALVFAGIAALSVAFAAAPLQSALTWVRYAMYLALPVVVAAACVRRANRTLLSWVFMASGAGTIAVAAYQLLVPTPYNLQFAASGIPFRVFSVFLNPNPYSEYLLLYVAVAAALAVRSKGGARWLAVLLGVAGSVALLCTWTRGSWLGFAAGGVVGLALLDLRALGVFLAGGAAALAALPGAFARFLSGFTVGESTQSRVSLWRLALMMIGKRPVTGFGVGGYPAAIEAEVAARPALAAGLDALKPHNSFLLLAAELGVLGGVAFAWLVWRACRVGVMVAEAAGGDTELRAESACYTVGVVAFAVSALTNNSFQNPRAAMFFWIVLGLQMAAGHAVLRARTVAGRAQEHDRADIPRALAPLRARWRGTALHRMLTAPPRTGGVLLAGGRVGQVLLGEGVTDAPELADWESGAATRHGMEPNER